MVLRSSAPMSDAITGLVSNTKPQPGYLRNGEIAEPALFVTSSLTTGVITDIFAWRESDLVNITLNSNTGMSDGTFRLSNSISIQDINADGYLDMCRDACESFTAIMELLEAPRLNRNALKSVTRNAFNAIYKNL